MPVDYNLSVNPIQVADMAFDISGNKKRAKAAAANQEKWNVLSHRMDADKFLFSKEQYYDNKQYRDNYLKKMISDADSLGISRAMALGAGTGASPITVGIPGNGSRVSGNAYRAKIPEMQMNLQQRNITEMTVNQTNKSRADADYAYYRMLNEKEKWEKSKLPESPQPMNPRFELMENNIDAAARHYQSGGYVRPWNAEVEMPILENYMEYFAPYVKPTSPYDAEDYYYNNGMGIAP